MSRRRSNSGMGSSPLSDIEIMAWQARNGLTLTAWESEVIDELDATYLIHKAKKN